MEIKNIETVCIIEMTTVDDKVYRRYCENNWVRFQYDEEMMLPTYLEDELEEIYQNMVKQNHGKKN